LNGVTHSYGNARAVDDVTLEVKAGELVALLGPSGCALSQASFANPPAKSSLVTAP